MHAAFYESLPSASPGPPVCRKLRVTLPPGSFGWTLRMTNISPQHPPLHLCTPAWPRTCCLTGSNAVSRQGDVGHRFLPLRRRLQQIEMIRSPGNRPLPARFSDQDWDKPLDASILGLKTEGIDFNVDRQEPLDSGQGCASHGSDSTEDSGSNESVACCQSLDRSAVPLLHPEAALQREDRPVRKTAVTAGKLHAYCRVMSYSQVDSVSRGSRAELELSL
jgi:hypothetical protein